MHALLIHQLLVNAFQTLSEEGKQSLSGTLDLHIILQGGNNLIAGWNAESILKIISTMKIQQCKKVHI